VVALRALLKACSQVHMSKEEGVVDPPHRHTHVMHALTHVHAGVHQRGHRLQLQLEAHVRV